MKLFTAKFILLLLWVVLLQKQVNATDSTKTVNAVVLLPLHLDSLFSNGNFNFGNNIPKFSLPALEFYNGVQLAADSLQQEGIKARIEIVDSRGASTLEGSLNSKVHVPSLVIGVIQSGNELKTVSAITSQKQIPFISATYPNDGGVTGQPGLLIINSTLKTHCFALYTYLQRNARGNNLVVFNRQKNADERLINYFKEAEKYTTGARFKWKLVNVSDTFNAFETSVYLDSTKINTVIGASLDKDFAARLISNLSKLKSTYPANVFGMPTWDDLPLDKPEFKGIDVYYSTPFVSYSGNAAVFSSISKKFKALANSRASDMVFKGFEITYRYIKTMAEHPDDFMQFVNDPKYRIFAEFNFQPVISKENDLQTDYYENKKIYFVKKTDGQVRGVYN